MSAMTTLIGGLTTGFVVARLLDPVRGRRRRALVRDQAVRASHAVGDAVSVTARDLRHRTQGVVASARATWRGNDTPDDRILAERVRAKIGGATGHSRAIEVGASNGRVTLRGPILADEVAQLVRRVEAVRGVREVVDELDVRLEPGDVPGLQGAPRAGGPGRFELWQEHWSPTVRLLAGATGAVAGAYGLRRGGVTGTVGATAGALLLARSLTDLSFRRLLGIGAEGAAMVVQKTIHVAAPIETVFDLWSHYERFPEFMRHVRSVERLDETRALWTIAGPGGVPITWETHETVREEPMLIAWETVEGAPVRHAGRVRFDPEDTGTRVHVQMSYTPPLGAAGHAVAWLFGADPRHAMHEDLVRFKSLLEDGKTSVSGRTVTEDEVRPGARG
jgi:uncharacterized membrane protein